MSPLLASVGSCRLKPSGSRLPDEPSVLFLLRIPDRQNPRAQSSSCGFMPLTGSLGQFVMQHQATGQGILTVPFIPSASSLLFFPLLHLSYPTLPCLLTDWPSNHWTCRHPRLLDHIKAGHLLPCTAALILSHRSPRPHTALPPGFTLLPQIGLRFLLWLWAQPSCFLPPA